MRQAGHFRRPRRRPAAAFGGAFHCLSGAKQAILWAWPPLLKKPAAAGSASRPTAAVVLLAVEGLLWLSERFHWLPKGWPVVIAIGAVGALLLLMSVSFAAALLFHWRFQYGILSLLVLTVAVALPCAGWRQT